MSDDPRIHAVLDAGPAVHQSAGLSRYTERLAAHLLQDHRQRIDVHLFFNSHSGHRLPPSLRQAPARSVSVGQVAWRLACLASQLLRRPWLEPVVFPAAAGDRRPPALYHATEHLLPYFRGPTVLTVHDLIFERYPQHHTWRNRLFLQLGMRLFVAAAGAIIAVSRHTQRDVLALYAAPAEKVHVIYEGIDTRFKPAAADAVQHTVDRYSPGRPYLLMVGTLEPRKNHAGAMRALARLKGLGYPHRLLIVGGHGWLFEPITALVRQLGLRDDVTFAGFVPDADLPALYSGAACLLQPSLYEGFGFPVLEAMACGAPVICSDASSLPEVAGDAALLVKPDDDAMLAAAIQRVADSPELAAHLRAAGAARAAAFRWETCAAETAALYAQVVDAARPRFGRGA